jgi:hypothetical protein
VRYLPRISITSLNFGQNRQNDIQDLFDVSVANAFGFFDEFKQPEVA